MVEALENRIETINPKVNAGGDSVVTLPALNTSLPALPPIQGKPLRFAPGGTIAPHAIPAVKPRARARRRPTLDVFDLAVIFLIAVCAAVCVYRLFWAL